MHRTVEGIVEIGNQEGRIEALQDLVEAICDRKQLHQTELAALRGKLSYASSRTVGRVAMCAVKILSKHLTQNQNSNLCEPELLLVRDTLETIKESPPRSVEAFIDPRPVIIFTDGACEDEGNQFPMALSCMMFRTASANTLAK